MGGRVGGARRVLSSMLVTTMVTMVAACNTLSGVGDYREIDCRDCPDVAPSADANLDGVPPNDVIAPADAETDAPTDAPTDGPAPSIARIAVVPYAWHPLTSSTFSFDEPTAIQSDDFMILALLYGDDAAVYLTDPVDWNRREESSRFGPTGDGFYYTLVWYDKKADATDPRPIAFSSSSSSTVNVAAALVAYRGVGSVDHTVGYGGACVLDVPSIAIAQPNAVIVVSTMIWPPDFTLTWSAPAGMSPLSAPSDPVQLFSLLRSSPGLLDSQHFSCNGSQWGGASLLALYPK